jgi:hypothetical protein
MKHGSFKVVCLIFWVCITALSAFGDENTVDFTSVVLESFDGNSDYVWKTDASKFTTRTEEASFPQLAYIDTWPIAAFGYNREGRDIKSLGIHGRFDRRGYNWIDVYPTLAADGEEAGPAEIPIPGRVQYLDMWVWGANLNFYIEAFVRDYQGVVHTIRLGNIGYAGWRNLRANIPAHIRQAKRILPSYAGLTFVKFRIWTQPAEKVADFYIYFKQFKVLTDTFESLFDGDELADPDRVQELWTGGGASGAAGTN